MRQRLPIFFFFTLWLAISVACVKQPNPVPETQIAAQKISGKIVYTGPIAADGCGYLVRTNDNQDFKPMNLSAAFQQDGLPVTVSYTVSSEPFACGLLPTEFTQINIVSIEKR